MFDILIAAAIVSVGETEMKTYPFSDPDPIPAVEETRYPYFRYDGSTATARIESWKTVTLENEKLRVTMLPEVGGKIYSATDKATGNELLYVNRVMKFRDIAMRGPWVSGGIEFNFGIIGHAPSSSTPVDWFARTNADGSVSCFVSSPEYITRTVWQVEVRLGAEAEEFETHVTWYNASLLPAPYYHWMNAAYSVRGNPEFLFPGDAVIGHQGEIETETWPYLTARRYKCDTFEGNAWGGPKSFHILPGHNGFYGIWWPEKGFGSYHRSEPYEKFGRKIWLWALSREGGIWEDLLTDSDGQYTELQSGRCFNQPRYDNYKTPFKHQVFAPGSTETFVEHWGPVRARSEVAADIAPERPLPKPRPIRPPADFDWSSAWGEYVRGTQFLAERHDLEGAEHLRAAIEKDRFFAPAYAALAGFELRRGNYRAVHELCEKALAINAYDGLADYLDGFAHFVEGDQVTARERLGVASMQPQYRSAALALVARGYLKSGDRVAALAAAQKALAANPLNVDAILAAAIALRGRGEAQRAFLAQALEKLPLLHALRYEAAKAGIEKDFGRYVANELPHETYLELGSWYEETGYADDARRFFTLAGENILAKARLGDWDAAKRLTVAGAFPFRREDLPALEKAVFVDGHWKFRYLLGVLKHYFGYKAEAAKLFAACGDEPDDPVFYQVRASVGAGEAALADLRRAQKLGDNWRLGRQLVDYFEAAEDYKAMLETTTAYIAKYPTCNPLQIAHGRALLKTGRYRDCMDYLKGVTLLPSEHRDSGTAIWQEAQKALGLELTWPENLGQGKPYPKEPVDNRQYEQRVTGRPVAEYPPTEDFEGALAWTAETENCEAKLALSDEQQRSGKTTLKVSYHGDGKTEGSIFLKPAKPIAIEKGEDTLSFWMWHDHFGCGANKDPENPNLRITAVYAGADGARHEVDYGRLCWRNWDFEIQPVAKGARAFLGLKLKGKVQKPEWQLHLDNVTLFKVENKPLGLKPRAKRNLKPLKGANLGMNTGDGTLPFPTREETSLPMSGQPADGEPLVQFKGYTVKGPATDKLEITETRIGRTLVVDVYAPAGAVTEISTSLPSEAKFLKTVSVPYLAFKHGGRRCGVDLLEGGLYRFGFIDWYRSNATYFDVRRGARGCELVAVYQPDLSGRYNEVSERFFLTLSPKFEETLPTIANPVSPYKHIAGKKLWRVHAWNDPKEDRRFWKLVHRYGMREVVINDHETQWRDAGESFTTRLKAAPGKGGDAAMIDYSKYLRETLGFVYGPYNNFTDFGSANPEMTIDRLPRTADGRYARAWMRCFAFKPCWAPEACDKYAPALAKKFGFNTAYCDVHTAIDYHERTDFDPRVAGAATGAAVFYSWGEVMLGQKRAWKGPVYSEGNQQFYFCGLTDGNYAQDWGVDFDEADWILDFDLRKMHDLECSFGMGSVPMYKRPKTPLEKAYYIPNAPTRADRVDLVDRFIGCSMAYGHTGFLVMDWCFTPYSKPFGRAYGAAARFDPDNDEGIPYAMRSYYMIQQAAARYTQAKAKEILYIGADGTAMEISKALPKGANARCQVAVSYDDGTFVAVNRNSARLRAKVFGRAIDLPANGYTAWTADGSVFVELGDKNGKSAHKFDYAETPAYIFVDGRGRLAEGRLARSAGTAVCRPEGDGWEVIPFRNVPCAFKLAFGRAVALDFDGRELGPAEIRREGDWREIVPVPGAFSYRVTTESVGRAACGAIAPTVAAGENFGCVCAMPGTNGVMVNLSVRGVDFTSSPRLALDCYVSDLESAGSLYLALTDGKGAKRRYEICELESRCWNRVSLDREADCIFEKGQLDWTDVRKAGVWVSKSTNENLKVWLGNLCAEPPAFACRAPAPDERRFAWCLAKAYADRGDWEATAEFLKARKFTDVIVQAGRVGGTHYDSAIAPRAKGSPKGDAIRAAIAACRPRGIRVHAMLSVFRTTKSETPKEWMEHLVAKEMVQRDPKGGLVNYQHHRDTWLCPRSAETRALVLSLVRELVETVGVDGVQLDYIRFASPEFCYCPRCLKAFSARMGRDYADAAAVRGDTAASEDWLKFREEAVSDTIRAVRDDLRAATRKVELSATFFSDAEEKRATLGQDYAHWAREGLVEMLFPMDYTTNSRQFRKWVTRQQAALAGTSVKLYPGIVICSKPCAVHPERVIRNVDCVRELGLPGFAAYVIDVRGAKFFETLDWTAHGSLQ